MPNIAKTFYLLSRGSVLVTPIDVKENSGNNLTDYQVLVQLTSSWDGWNYVMSDGSDIYFLDANYNPLYFWIEDFNYSNKFARIWVKVPSIPANSVVRIYMCYGVQQNPYSSYRSASKVWDFFEDWEGTRDPNWVDGSQVTASKWEYASPALKTGKYRLHFKTGRSSSVWDNMWWKGKKFDNFRFIAYVRADYSDDDSGVLFRSQGTEASSSYEAVGYRVHLPRAGYQYFKFVRVNTDGSQTPLASYGAVNTSDIVRFEITCYGSSLKVRIERPAGNYLTTLSATDTTFSSGYIGLVAPEWGSNRNPSFDTFCVGKYIDPEPSVTINPSLSIGKDIDMM